MVCCAVQFSLEIRVVDSHASMYFSKNVLSGITLLKGRYKTKTDPVHFNLPGNHVNFCSPAKVASRVQ